MDDVLPTKLVFDTSNDDENTIEYMKSFAVSNGFTIRPGVPDYNAGTMVFDLINMTAQVTDDVDVEAGDTQEGDFTLFAEKFGQYKNHIALKINTSCYETRALAALTWPGTTPRLNPRIQWCNGRHPLDYKPLAWDLVSRSYYLVYNIDNQTMYPVPIRLIEEEGLEILGARIMSSLSDFSIEIGEPQVINPPDVRDRYAVRVEHPKTDLQNHFDVLKSYGVDIPHWVDLFRTEDLCPAGYFLVYDDATREISFTGQEPNANKYANFALAFTHGQKSGVDQSKLKPKGKLPLHLIRPEQRIALARVFELGVMKYGDAHGYLKEEPEDIESALLRHLTAYQSNRFTDKSSGLPHSWFIMANAAILVSLELERAGKANESLLETLTLIG